MIPEIPENGLILILGGARSGKSSFVEKIARDAEKAVLFIATATAGDDEMTVRIRKHQASRPAGWQTLELPRDIGRNIERFIAPVVIVDCITLLVSNILCSLPENTQEETIMHHVQIEIEDLIALQARSGGQWMLVSNEVGLGLVPPYPLGRVYRDALGFANQALARAASRVILMVAGLPMVIK
ncbi:MAG: bifunctional adenosylcobinamide kinase/adenosylcobinamide-phosphate guanylyltransferase [Deltaproteobacteria bacterium HGW-Deltaproteobacteria-6]|nr:MAG: bifunctional adenosylcobinamide kinase/adenosylcobinamide-phosphate guanylyltransferase [Deltaproteobacteria bacterium HGW-Deltaproteobacteria-6]